MTETTAVANAALDWESNARADACFAILSDPQKAGGEWDVDGFLATGRREMQVVFDHLERRSLTPVERGRALDFGCGVGRLSLELASRFERVVGVDISPSMLERARELAERADLPVDYLQNDGPHLDALADGSFDFIYSNIVLQHVASDLQRSYIAEFCRVLRPGGVAVFQIPSYRRGLEGWLRRRLPARATAVVRRARNAASDRGLNGMSMEMNCLAEDEVESIVVAQSCQIAEVSYTNATVPDFNGNLLFLHPLSAWRAAAGGGYVSPMYVVRRSA